MTAAIEQRLNLTELRRGDVIVDPQGKRHRVEGIAPCTADGDEFYPAVRGIVHGWAITVDTESEPREIYPDPGQGPESIIFRVERPVYGCSHCGERHRTINESFAHDCPLRPRPTLDEVLAALADVTPRYLAAQALVTELDGEFLLTIPAAAAARFEGTDRRRGTAANRVGDPLLKRGYRLVHTSGGTIVR